MRAFAVALLVAAAVALPDKASKLLPREQLQSMTLGEASGICGTRQQVKCCNHDKSHARPDTARHNGLLSNLLGGLLGGDDLGLVGHCSALDVTVIGATDLLKKHCQGSIACCDRPRSNTGDGLVNLGLPCVALGSVL
ncbi:hypothetical protein HIM_05813 [Hirsutella minnesotensis 3608]|uniref:Hydrophobin n=1 Tax=Hirsutella minnesotensis 3608 TaxID=1043627 RepID=A0A0F7ZJU8_9HYPO|nr:hypothetical protein HIM_05813 [Hirsutella minnesotensis 3608]